MGSVVLAGATSGSTTITPTDAVTATLTLPSTTGTLGLASGSATQSINAQNTFGFKNRIINGAMAVSQYNGTSSQTGSAFFPLDRFQVVLGAGTFTGQQVTDAPAGYAYSLKLTQASYGSATYKVLQQFIEGYNIFDLGWGTANAKTVTVSFWVKSSVTGTYTFTLQNAATGAGRWSYVSTYTISSANTWEQKTITVAGPTVGTWASDNTRGIGVLFDLGSTPYNTGTLNSWQNSNVFYANGAVDLSNSAGATWYLTGVQLEVGTQATSFDFRDYGRELMLCQRYFQTTYPSGYALGSTGSSIYYSMETISQATTAFLPIGWNMPVVMRTTPTATLYNPSTGSSSASNNIWLTSGSSLPSLQANVSQNGVLFYVNNSSVSATAAIMAHFAVTAEL